MKSSQMNQKEIIIKISNEGVSFNPNMLLSIQQTNIPIKHLLFRTNQDIFWKVKMIEYENESKCLKVSVSNYDLDSILGFETQNPKKEICQIEFDKFDWIKLQPFLSYFQKSELYGIIFNTNENPISENIDIASNNELSYNEPANSELIELEKQNIIDPPQIEYKSVTRIIKEDFWVNFNDSQFMLGYVSFRKHIKDLNKSLDFKILNDHVLAEFDNIKFWFSKKLQTKKFHVSATITIIDDSISEISATSKQINLINHELIEGVKYQRTLAITKELKITMPDKALFTADEVFNQINTNDLEGNVFNQSEQDILEFFLSIKNVRNKSQLAYLSGKKQSANHILRYTLNPNFGFLFLVEGEQNNHFIWELLESRATYIWSIEKTKSNIKLQYNRIESIVNLIRTSGRENYKNAYKNSSQDADLVFNVLYHKFSNSVLKDDFPLWKSRLNELLI